MAFGYNRKGVLQMDEDNKPQGLTLKSLVNTPFRKILFGIQVLSWVLIVGSPVIGGAIGKALDLRAVQIAGVIAGFFIAGEILFYGSMAFLGKAVIDLVRERLKSRFRSGKAKSNFPGK